MIRLLDEATIGQIAAGEIVERPSSVVKELVENALDAGASFVSVAVWRGGIDGIDVRDDGEGIALADLPLALRRHATSKLLDAAGLERIATLGFRGEGLASIAAVARVRLSSRTAGKEFGSSLEAFGEEAGAVAPLAMPAGTHVEVRDLFANVPVRRDFLRTPAAEFARVSSFLSTLSLAYPKVRFSLAHDGRDVWTLPAAESAGARLAAAFGAAAARELIPLEGSQIVRGYVSRPGFDRPDRRMQFLFVNGRLLRSTLFSGAWSAGYATFAMSGRRPYGVLMLDVAAERVDPNVHPTKSDVRLRDAQALASDVRRTIAATLRRNAVESASRAVSFAPGARDSAAVGNPPDFSGTAFEQALPIAASETSGSEELRVLAQLDDTFILATDGEALVLIDQHAAHERVAYEEIERRGTMHVPGEPLLVPYALDVDAGLWERFEAARPALLEAGLEVEEFGDRAYRVTATPAGYGARPFDVRGFVADLAEDVPGLDSRTRTWATLACHSVVRAGERLEHAEMSALIRRLVSCRNPMHCPHGRPTIVRIEADAIARMFKR